MAAEGAEMSKINVVVKTSKNKETIAVEPTATIKEFKEMISEKFGAPVPQLCLIFAGRILKDHDTLASSAIKDGLTVHLVIKSENRGQQQAASHASQTPSPPTALSPSVPLPTGTPNPLDLAGLGGLGAMGQSGNLQEMTQQLQQQMMSNPDTMRQILDNPIVQSMMSNPELMRNMILSNPQMQQLVERNPEISHILNNPDLMRQTMEMARNPSVMQEMMRNQDRALSNLESLPGGFNALQRMYTDIQEPMMNAAQEQMQQMHGNPFSALFGQGGATTGSSTPATNTNSTSNNPQLGTENLSPLPNPWAPPAARQSTPPAATTTPQAGAPSTTTTPTATTGSTTPPPANPLMSGMFQAPAMQNLMQQMSSNPQMLQQMMQAPYMQQMMQQMVSNPDLMSNILRTNPMFQGNPQLAEQVSSRLPEFMAQMQNPAFQQSMANPRVLQAMMQIQQGMQQLQAEAPGLVQGGGLGIPPFGMSTTTSGSTSNSAVSTTSTAGSNTTTTPSSGSTPGNPNPMIGSNPDQMAQLMAQMMSVMSSQGQHPAGQSPEVRFRTQLEQLAAMGFVDQQRNIQALTATGGDVNAAIERLLQ
ncbi:ubiquilin-1 isoform X2 [Nematostella vectensis]|uniref:ubiquilin-1 isoform X2 n=1 Tax=Nematostella vectensis TaxID=45351 RepID=UPI0020770228|nr:ubiquilin-1 isoform X2 [Nematostella vectensis]